MHYDNLKERYSRNILIPQIQERGQEVLCNSSVLVIGCGGLGCPAAMYLCAAGLGRLGLVDGDRVEVSNLQRQILYGDVDLGRLKVELAAERLKNQNSRIVIDTYDYRLNSENIDELFEKYHLILDCTDNFETRYLINEGVHRRAKPLVSGAVLGFAGQATTILPGQSPCYKCFFPEPPPPSIFPTSAVLGILGTTAGTIAMIQATEAVKILTGIGSLLTGRLLLYDGLDMIFDCIDYHRRNDCTVCGQKNEKAGFTESGE